MKLLDKAWRLRQTEQKESRKLVAQVLSSSNNDRPEYFHALTIDGTLKIYESDFINAEVSLLKAYKYYQETEHGVYESRNCNSLGMLYMMTGDLSQSITYLNRGYEVASVHKVPEMLVYILYNISEIYKDVNRYDTALFYLKVVEEILQVHEHSLSDVIYSSLALCYLETNNLKKTEEYATKCVALSKSNHKTYMLSTSYVILAEISLRKGDTALAKSYCKKSIDLRIADEDHYALIISYITYSNVLLKNKEYKKAENIAQKALSITKDIDSFVNNHQLYSILSDANKGLCEYQRACQYADLYKEASEEHFNKNLKDRIAVHSAEQLVEMVKKNAEKYKLQSKALKRKSDALSLISDIGQSIINTSQVDEVVEKLYNRINTMLDVTVLSVGVYDQGVLDYQFILSGEQNFGPYQVNDDSDSLALRAIKENRVIYLNDFDLSESEVSTFENENLSEDMRSLLFCPLYNQDKAIGVISLQSHCIDAYSKDDIDLLKGLSSYLAIAIDKANRETVIINSSKVIEKNLDDLRRTQNELVKAEKLLGFGKVISGVAHELNTPIGCAITVTTHQLSNLKKLKNEYSSKGLKKSYFEEYINKSDQALTSISDALHQSSDMIQNFKSLFITKEPHDLETCSTEFIGKSIYLSNRILLDMHDVKFDFHTCHSMVHTYHKTIAEIIHHLIANSIAHSFKDIEDRNIQLELISNEESIIIRYQDSGRDIPDAVQIDMFEPFTSTRKKDGFLGIGLHAVHNMVTYVLSATIDYDGGFTILIPKVS